MTAVRRMAQARAEAPRKVEQRVLTHVARHDLLRSGDRVLLLLSGGADSMAMLELVRVCDRRLDLGLSLGALHVDYGMRGAESARDRALVERAAAAAGITLEVVEAAGHVSQSGFQSEARRLRFAAARRLADRDRYDRIAVGHNLDDQAETVVYRLVKYGGPRALAGMAPRAGVLVRPIMCLRSEELRAYCASRGIDFGLDESNSGEGYARNLVRHSVMPQLERLNPRVAEALAAAAEMAREEQDLLTDVVDEAWEDVVVDHQVAAGAPHVRLDLTRLRPLAPALRTLILRRLVRSAAGPHVLVDRRTTAALASLIESVAGTKRVALRDGWEAVREYDRLVLRRPRRPHHCTPVAVPVPGPGAGAVEARFCDSVLTLDQVAGPAGLHSAPIVLGARRPFVRLTLRHPAGGERFRPLGMPADISLAGFLREQKVPLDLRRGVLVVDVDGLVAWVGLPGGPSSDRVATARGRVADSFRVTDSTAYTLRMRVAGDVTRQGPGGDARMSSASAEGPDEEERRT